MTDFVFLIILTGFVCLFLIDIVFVFCWFRLKKKLKLFFEQDKLNLVDAFTNQAKKIEKQEEKSKKILEELSALQKLSKNTFQKIGIVRFNPFKEVGGNQSFSIALLDGRNNGFVITSLYSRDGNRVYAKSIENGLSKYSLSEEEKKAIAQAMSKN